MQANRPTHCASIDAVRPTQAHSPASSLLGPWRPNMGLDSGWWSKPDNIDGSRILFLKKTVVLSRRDHEGSSGRGLQAA